MKTKIETLAIDILKNNGVHREYSDEDMKNASLIFKEVFMAKMYDKHRPKLSDDGMEVVAREAGKSLRQTIKLFTGIDLHDV